ncbi:MAG: MerR family transcriptional regulator [Microbacteriaceae bacterium]
MSELGASSQAPLSSEADGSSQYERGLLFTDGLLNIDDDHGFSGTVAAKAAGITYRQLDYWARTQLVEPSLRIADGSGSQRLYGFHDVLVLRLVKRLLDTGISLQQIRIAVNQLHESGIQDLAQITLMSDGASVYLCGTADEVIDLVNQGQGVFGIAVGKVLREVESNLVHLDTVRVQPLDELAERRARKASS